MCKLTLQRADTTRTTRGSSQPPTQATIAPSVAGSLASTVPVQQVVLVYFPSPIGSQTSQQPEIWFINMIEPSKRILMAASLDGAEYALLD